MNFIESFKIVNFTTKHSVNPTEFSNLVFHYSWILIYLLLLYHSYLHNLYFKYIVMHTQVFPWCSQGNSHVWLQWPPVTSRCTSTTSSTYDNIASLQLTKLIKFIKCRKLTVVLSCVVLWKYIFSSLITDWYHISS